MKEESTREKLENWEIELLEDLPVRADEKWYTLLAMTGHKGASWIIIESDTWREGDSPVSVEQKLPRIIEILDKLKIHYSVSIREPDSQVIFQSDESKGLRTRFVQLADIFVASSQESLDEIIDARKNNDEKRIGLAFGYPKTAVDAFKTEEALTFTERDELDYDKRVVDATWFMLSRSNYENELAVVDKWLKILEENSQLIASEVDRFASSR